MNLNPLREITPLNHQTYKLISDQFITESHKVFWALAWFTGEKPEVILSTDVDSVYRNPRRRTPRDMILFPCSDKSEEKKPREVPIHKLLELELKSYEPPLTGFLFPSLYRDECHLSRQAMDKALRRALKKAGLEGQGYSLCSPRYGFIYRLEELGFSIRLIQSITGYQSLAALKKNLDISPETRRKAIDSF